jgi:phosphopantetheinyl transferase (holo-ACP synthase)
MAIEASLRDIRMTPKAKQTPEAERPSERENTHEQKPIIVSVSHQQIILLIVLHRRC